MKRISLICIAISFFSMPTSLTFGMQKSNKVEKSKRIILSDRATLRAEAATPLEAATKALEKLAQIRGIDVKDLYLERATELGSGNKTVFVYRQTLNGLFVEDAVARIVVRHGNPNVVIHASADLAAFSPAAFQQDLFDASRVAVLAREIPEYKHLPAWSNPEKVIYYGKDLDHPVRAWKIQAQEPELSRQEAYTLFLNSATGELLDSRNEIINGENISGNVQANATPGLLPDVSYNVPVAEGLSQVNVQLVGGAWTYTNLFGDYVIPQQGNVPVTLATTLKGPWVNVFAAQGTPLQLQQTVTPPGPANFLYNETPAEFNTAQVNAFIHTTGTHDFYKQYQPGFAQLDTSLPCFVNVSDFCNANFNALYLTINFFNSGLGCTNSAYSTIVSHEYGHFILNRLGFIGVQGAFGEGFADTVSILHHNDPIIGKDFKGPGTFVRNLQPNVSFPCPGAVGYHYCGQVLAGLWWDIKTKIQQSDGEGLGLEVTRQLFTDWSQITAGGDLNGNSAYVGTVIEVLIADDDDGDFSNGTPHLSQICEAFWEHGVPCITDCNGNGVFDGTDIAVGTSSDCNGNFIPDECDLIYGYLHDCNQNGIPDECEGITCDGGSPGECLPEPAYVYGWTQSFGGAWSEEVNSIAVDSSGNVLTTGFFNGANVDFDPTSGVDLHSSNSTIDIFVSKLHANGSYAWTRTFGGSFFGTSTDIGKSVAVDAAGNVYVTGSFRGTDVDMDPTEGIDLHSTNGFGTDIFVMKLYPDGSYAWAKTFGGTSSSSDLDIGKGIAVNLAGDIYVTGSFSGANVDFDPSAAVDLHSSFSNSSPSLFVTKFHGDGSYVWTRTVEETTAASSRGETIAADDFGDVFITGSFSGTIDFDPTPNQDNHASVGISADIYVTKLHADGSYGWTVTFGGTNTAWDIGTGIAVDHAGHVFITGNYAGNNVDFDPTSGVDLHSTVSSLSDFFIMKLNTDGSYGWTDTLGGTASDKSFGIAVDAEDNVYVTGSFYGTVDFDPTSGEDIHTIYGSTDIFLVQLHGDGSYGWALTFGSVFADPDSGKAVTVDSEHHVYFASQFTGAVDFKPLQGSDVHVAVGNQDIAITKLKLPNPSYMEDCNGNGVYDGCDINSGYSQDQNNNEIPDECEIVELVGANPPTDNPYLPGMQPFRDVLQTGRNDELSQGIGGRKTPNEGEVVYKSISVVFSGTPVPVPTPNNIQIVSSGGNCPTIVSVNGSGSGPYTIYLDRPIPPGYCTTLHFAGTPVGQRLQYESLPGDVDMDGKVDAGDLSALREAIAGGASDLPENLARYDINRSGKVDLNDLKRLTDLIHGENTTRPWLGASVVPCW